MIKVTQGLALLALVLALVCTSPATAALHCSQPMAKLVVLKGSGELQRAENQHWDSLTPEEEFCPGDSIRTSQHASAAIAFRNDMKLLRLAGGSTLSLPIAEEETSLVNLIKGAVLFMVRDPNGLEVNTPFHRGAVEGTEFSTSADDNSGSTWVLEGKVRVSDEQDSWLLKEGESIRLGSNASNQPIKITPADGIQWALNFPPTLYISDLVDPELRASSSYQRAIEEIEKNNLPKALASLELLPDYLRDHHYYNLLGSLLLTLNHPEEARIAVEKSLNTSLTNSGALALGAIIALSRNEKEFATIQAEQALVTDPNFLPGLLAYSYAQQAGSLLHRALTTANEAREKHPHSSLAWSRKSDLELMLGNHEKAKNAAARALQLDPESATAYSGLGFTQLVSLDITNATLSFKQALKIDPTLPSAHLGAGLALVRQGLISQGRLEIELAVLFDPVNSLYRSYLGKAYEAEYRPSLAKKQFQLAKKFDPLDPTPWFFEGILDLQQNSPLTAITSSSKALALNNTRSVERDSPLLNQDAAARHTLLGRAYQASGNNSQEEHQGLKAIQSDFNSYAGYNLLADSNNKNPQKQQAAASAHYQAVLRMPYSEIKSLNLSQFEHLPVLEGSKPITSSHNEFGQLYASDGSAASIGGSYGSYGSQSADFSIGTSSDQYGINLGHLKYKTDGFLPNQQLNHQLTKLTASWRLPVATESSAIISVLDRSSTNGDLNQNLRRFTDSDFRQETHESVFFLSGKSRISASKEIQGSIDHSEFDRTFSEGGLDIQSYPKEEGANIQLTQHFKNHSVLIGSEYRQGKNQYELFSTNVLDQKITHRTYRLHYLSKNKQFPHFIGLDINKLSLIENGATDTKTHHRANPSASIGINSPERFNLQISAQRTLEFLSANEISPWPSNGFDIDQTNERRDFDTTNRLSLKANFKPHSAFLLGASLTHQKSKQLMDEADRYSLSDLGLSFDWSIDPTWKLNLTFNANRFKQAKTQPSTDYSNHTTVTNPCTISKSETPLTLSFYPDKKIRYELTFNYISAHSTHILAENIYGDLLCNNDSDKKKYRSSGLVVNSQLTVLLPKSKGEIRLGIYNLTDSDVALQDMAFFDKSRMNELSLGGNSSFRSFKETQPHAPERVFFAGFRLKF